MEVGEVSEPWILRYSKSQRSNSSHPQFHLMGEAIQWSTIYLYKIIFSINIYISIQLLNLKFDKVIKIYKIKY